MALSNYDELKASIADFLDRDDLTTVIPDFIAMAEATMDRQLRHWRMERRSNATVDSQYTALPSDFLEPLRFVLKTNPPHAVELIGQGEIMARREGNDDTAGSPRFYALTDGTIELFPTPDQDYTLEMVYYSDIDKLSTSNTSNWVLQYHPDAYLYGALVHSAPFLGEDARMQTWVALFQNAIDAINAENEKAKSGGSGRRLRIRSY